MYSLGGRSRNPPKANGVDCIGDELAAAKGYARCLAAPLDALGGSLQLLLIQPADLDLQGEGCHCANAAHCFCCCLIGAVVQLACLYRTHIAGVKSTVLGTLCLLGGGVHSIMHGANGNQWH